MGKPEYPGENPWSCEKKLILEPVAQISNVDSSASVLHTIWWPAVSIADLMFLYSLSKTIASEILFFSVFFFFWPSPFLPCFFFRAFCSFALLACSSFCFRLPQLSVFLSSLYPALLRGLQNDSLSALHLHGFQPYICPLTWKTVLKVYNIFNW